MNKTMKPVSPKDLKQSGNVDKKTLEGIKAMSEDPRWKKFLQSTGESKSPR